MTRFCEYYLHHRLLWERLTVANKAQTRVLYWAVQRLRDK